MWVWEAAQLVSPGHWNCPPQVMGRATSPTHMVRNGDISPKWVLVYCESHSQLFPKTMKRPAYHDSLISSHVVPMVPGGITDDWTKAYALWHTKVPNATKMNEEVLERKGRKWDEEVSFIGFMGGLVWLRGYCKGEGYMGGNRKLPEVRCMMWNSQTINNEIIIKTNNHISILLFFEI